MKKGKNTGKDKEKGKAVVIPTEEDNLVIHQEQNKTKKFIDRHLYHLLSGIFLAGFIIFGSMFLYESVLQPYFSRKAIEKTKELYLPEAITATPTPVTDMAEEDTPVYAKDITRDEQGRLLQFSDLLRVNPDVKGWISIPDSNIDYVVMQTEDKDQEYYLHHNMFRQDDKAGCLFLDQNASVEYNSQNLTIHGHNMTSTNNMFHYLMKFKDLDYYKERPVFTFDTLFQKGQWKIFSVFFTNGSSKKEPVFDYTKANFSDSSDFLNFVYQLRIRSIYKLDTVDVNEKDQLLTLSTCTYEVKDYRLVIVARKVRDGEDPAVAVDSVTENQEPYYPYTWYYRFGGKAPELPATFEEALSQGQAKWYTPVE